MEEVSAATSQTAHNTFINTNQTTRRAPHPALAPAPNTPLSHKMLSKPVGKYILDLDWRLWMSRLVKAGEERPRNVWPGKPDLTSPGGQAVL